MKQSSLIQGLHFPYELQVISSENDMLQKLQKLESFFLAKGG